jgi:SPP1 gp7 family putative phage head morphogenesis protein
MNLFSRVKSYFTGPAEESREGGAEHARSVGNLAAWLANWDGREGKLSDPYNLSPWVRRAIQHIAGPIAQVEIEFAEGDSLIEDADLTAFWNRPAAGLSRASRLSRYDAIEATVGWLSLKGAYFWILDDTWMTNTAAKSPIIIARPDRMKAIMDDGELIGWQWTDGQGRRHPLIPDNVIHSRFWNPEDDIMGSAPMTSALQSAEADYAAGRFWKSLAEANGDLGETVIAPNGVTPEQQAQITMMLRRKREAARKGKYLPSFFVGDIKTEAAKIQSPDAASVTQRLQNRHEVYIAFGVPPSFAEVTASYSIGSASDRYKLIEETCQPIAAKIAEGIEEVSMRFRRGRRISARFNFDNHSTMQQVRAERMEAGRKMHERGVPWSVINEHLQLKLAPFPGWNTAWLPMNLVAVGETQDGKTQDAGEEQEASGVKVFEELEELLKGCPCHDQGNGDHARTQTRAPKKQALWEKLMKTRAPHVKRVRVIVDRALFEARKETLANIAAAAAAEKAIRAGAFDFIFDIGRFLELLVEPVFRVMVDGYGIAGNELLADELGSEEPFIEPDANGIIRLRERRNFIQDAGQEMWEETRNSLEEGIQAGESYDKLAARVRETFNSMSKLRSMRIAVTETSIAFETGRHDAMIQAGAEWKQWLTSQDDRVRATHVALDGKTVPMDEPFEVGGAQMMFPCDPAGPPSEIINCRCVHGPVDSPEDPDGINNDPTVPF